jgi:hypothetical protein
MRSSCAYYFKAKGWLPTLLVAAGLLRVVDDDRLDGNLCGFQFQAEVVLEGRKQALEVLVIDHCESAPTEN